MSYFSEKTSRCEMGNGDSSPPGLLIIPHPINPLASIKITSSSEK